MRRRRNGRRRNGRRSNPSAGGWVGIAAGAALVTAFVYPAAFEQLWHLFFPLAPNASGLPPSSGA